jgi:FAD/FMN-containing dehydrogenase
MADSCLLAKLRGLVGEAGLISDTDAMDPHLHDWRGRYRGAARCVVKPASTPELAQVVALLAREGVPMVPQAGNTGLVGGATPDASGNAVVINVSRMRRVRKVDAANNSIMVEAGCTLREVQDAAEAAGRLFPLSLAAEGSCEIGGNLSTNAGGVHVLRYGNARDLTLGLEVVLPDGRTWDGLRGLRKDNTGYDLKHLFLGAEGTLGIISAAVLKLFPRPRASAVAWLGVGNAAAAVDLLGRTAFELVVKNIPGVRPPLAGGHPWAVLVEASESLAGFDLGAELEESLMAEIESGLVADAAIARSLSQARDFWRLRESISEAQKIEGFSIKHDVSVPVSLIPNFLDRADAALEAAFPGVRIVAFGHVGDGNLHYNLSNPLGEANAELIGRSSDANRIVHDIVAELGGSISAEHGIGQLKRTELLRYKSEVEMEVMRTIKSALDPWGLMNPGKVL